MIIVVIGVMGAGKTTVGAALAARLGWRFLDADDFHPPENWAKLARGEALADADRWPWLARLRQELAGLLEHGESAVLACSALRQSYRDALVPQGAGPRDIRFVYLHAEPAPIAARLEKRTAHRAAAVLLPSQFAALEEPHDALRLQASEPPAQLVQSIVDAWALG